MNMFKQKKAASVVVKNNIGLKNKRFELYADYNGFNLK